MILEEPVLVKCPQCGQMYWQENLVSGNTIGSETWSDGKMFAPMLPDIIQMAKCTACQRIFWINQAEEGDLNEGEDVYDYPRIKEPGLEDYLCSLEKKNYRNGEQEFYIRLRLWWTYNDMHRYDKGFKEDKELKKELRKNLEELLPLCDENYMESNIMKAEIYRHLGEFENCRKILKKIPEGQGYDKIISKMKRKCLLRNKKVFKV